MKWTCHIRLGSGTDILTIRIDVRFTPKSGHSRLKADPIKKSGSVQGCANRRGSAIIAVCRGAASHHHGQLKITTPASSCAMRMGRHSATSTSKKTLGGDQRATCSPKMRPEGSL